MSGSFLRAAASLQNVVLLLALLLVPYFTLALFGLSETFRGRVSLAVVFFFTGIGHFTKSREMERMLPEWMPARRLVIHASGGFELLCAAALLVPALHPGIGWVVCLFLAALLPSNVSAAMRRVDFGGHAAGPIYLLVRVPLQFFLIGWAWWFSIKPS